MGTAVLFAVVFQGVLSAYSTATCDNLDSCSPAKCVKNYERNCVFPSSPVDFAAKIKGMGCKQCVQSSLPKCSKMTKDMSKLSGTGVQAAYCNDEFFVMWSNGLPKWDSGTYLSGVPLPPGGDAVCRVRTAGSYLNVFKIPLATTIAASANIVPSPLPGIPGMPEAGAVGVGIDGVPIFPNYNNRGNPTWISCEVDKCNAHSGKGQDYHYHGDPFGSNCLYSSADYTTTHPPVYGYSLDGYNIHGRYTAVDQDGQAVVLDACGGHTHSIHGESVYHYHAEVKPNQTTTALDGVPGSGPYSFTAFDGAPSTCWKGDVSKIANFWAGRQANFDRSKGTFETANDYENLRPCCQTTEAFLAPGITLSTASSSSSSTGFAATSSDFANGGEVSLSVRCERDGGSGKSPAISWTNAPAGTKSFAVAMVHYPNPIDLNNPNSYWLLWDLPSTTTSIASGNPTSIGTEGSDKDGRTTGFTPPCSPSGGVHTYTVVVYALSSESAGLGSVDSASVKHANFAAAVGRLMIAQAAISFTVGASASSTSVVTSLGSATTTVANNEQSCAAGFDNTGRKCPPNNKNGPCPPGCSLNFFAKPFQQVPKFQKMPKLMKMGASGFRVDPAENAQKFQVTSNMFTDLCLDASNKRLAIKKCRIGAFAQSFTVVDGLVVHDGNCFSSTLVLSPCTPDSVQAAAVVKNVHRLLAGPAKKMCVVALSRKKVKIGPCNPKIKKQEFTLLAAP